MELGSLPLYVYAPLLVSIALMMLLLRNMTALSKTLGISQTDPADAKRLSSALYGGELRLHDLGVHRTVWTIRLAFIGETVCILLFAYLIYRATEAV